MDELISRSLRGRTSPAEDALLDAWSNTSPQNEAFRREMSFLLELITAVSLRSASPPPSIQELVSGEKVLPPDDLSFQPSSEKRIASRRKVGIVASAAAAAAILLFLGLPGEPSADRFNLGTGEITTGRNETTTATLGDGTVVRLAPNSRLRITGEPGTREVWLEGRAYFAVTSNERSPFRVRTHGGDAVVLGTRFDLQAHQKDMRVLVLEGAVNVAAGGVSLDVEAQQLAEVSEAHPPTRNNVDESYMVNELKWVGDFLAFEATPLDQVARELSVHFGVPVRVLDDKLARETVRGVFSEEALEEVVGVICRAVAANCVVRPSGVTISP